MVSDLRLSQWGQALCLCHAAEPSSKVLGQAKWVTTQVWLMDSIRAYIRVGVSGIEYPGQDTIHQAVGSDSEWRRR
jgi:hypothetical protein